MNAHRRYVAPQSHLDTVLGFLLGMSLSAIIQFFFGSSAGSKSKEEKLIVLNETMRTQPVSAQGDGAPF